MSLNGDRLSCGKTSYSEEKRADRLPPQRHRKREGVSLPQLSPIRARGRCRCRGRCRHLEPKWLLLSLSLSVCVCLFHSLQLKLLAKGPSASCIRHELLSTSTKLDANCLLSQNILNPTRPLVGRPGAPYLLYAAAKA